MEQEDAFVCWSMCRIKAKQHRQHFRSVDLVDSDQSFVMSQQLQDACYKWLMAKTHNVEEVVDLVALEQFVAWLPRGTAEWVQCHHLTSLTQAGVAEPLPNLSLQTLSLTLFLLPGHVVMCLLEPHSGEVSRG